MKEGLGKIDQDSLKGMVNNTKLIQPQDIDNFIQYNDKLDEMYISDSLFGDFQRRGITICSEYNGIHIYISPTTNYQSYNDWFRSHEKIKRYGAILTDESDERIIMHNGQIEIKSPELAPTLSDKMKDQLKIFYTQDLNAHIEKLQNFYKPTKEEIINWIQDFLSSETGYYTFDRGLILKKFLDFGYSYHSNFDLDNDGISDAEEIINFFLYKIELNGVNISKNDLLKKCTEYRQSFYKEIDNTMNDTSLQISQSLK